MPITQGNSRRRRPVKSGAGRRGAFILPLSVEKLGDRITYLHVADNDGRVNAHLAVGRGTVDWDGVLLALKKHGFNGYAAIDVGNVPGLEAQYRESVEYLTRLAGKHGL
ncbi:MAG: sugar phosphate isomerase/epimerase family protein [Methanocella sp.]